MRRASTLLSASLLISALAVPTSAFADDEPDPGETKDKNAERVPRFAIDPVTDGLLIALTLTVSTTTEIIIRNGEIEAQPPDDTSELGPLDRWVMQQDSINDGAVIASDVGVLVAMGWAILDVGLTGTRKKSDRWPTYMTLYLQSAGFTWVTANLTKMAVRRPRPRAYMELRDTGTVDPHTTEALSFFSLHTAIVASIGSTATYLAFSRDGPVWEPWLIMTGAITATTVVGLGRMLGAAHFTTDVITGAVVGASIGVLVPHIHRVAPGLDIQASGSNDGGYVQVGGRW